MGFAFIYYDGKARVVKTYPLAEPGDDVVY